MRFLFTSIPGFGHFHPIAPLAHALKAAGHEVVFVTAPCFAPTVARAGFEVIPAGLDWDESRLLETLPEVAGVGTDHQGEWLMRNIFLDRSPRAMIPALLRIFPEWKPDVVLSGTFEFGAALAAETLGIPYAGCSISIRWTPWILRQVVGKAIARLRADHGLPADPDLAAFGRYLDLCFVPPSWMLTNALLRPDLTRIVRNKVLVSDLPLGQRLWGVKALILQRILAANRKRNPAEDAVPATTHFIRQFAPEPDPPPAMPGWLATMPRRPTVYVSLGTVFSKQYPQVFETILEGLADLPLNLVLTMGGAVDPARFGPQPENVHIAPFFTQEELKALLPHVDLCINHAGYSTVMESLARGIPLVLLPLAADQPVITQMCLVNGVAPDLPADVWRISAKGLPTVRPERLTPAMVRDAVTQALEVPGYCAAAAAMKAEIQGLPGLDEAVRLLERLA